MRATGPARVARQRVHRTVLAVLVTAALAAVALPATHATAATPRLGAASRGVRLVVQTVPGAAAAVTSAARAYGAVRVGQVRPLHALSLEVGGTHVAALRRALAARSDVRSVGLAHRRRLTDEPNDPRLGEQRSYLGAVGIPAAWDRGALGSAGVRIAVVDSGVDVRHPDLAGKVTGTYNAVTGGTDVHDVVGHGTGTASVAAAATGNGEGIAGAGRDTSILAVKVADVTGRIFTDDLARGIVWATDHGADVVNLSLGGPTTDPLERAAVAYAVAHDVVVVAAAGNEGSKVKQYPGALPGVLAVGATTASGASRASFSSYGPWVDLAAPGRSVVAATPGGGYESADGTSYSAPLVSAAAALLAGYRPGRSATQLAQALIGGTDAARYGFAHGLLHVDRSLDLLPPASVPVLTGPADGSSVSGSTTVNLTSSAPRVSIGLGDLTATVPVTGGAASATFDTFGLVGSQPVRAADCSTIGQCSDSTATATVSVDNAGPVVTAPVAGTEVRGDGLAVTADAPAGAAAVRFLIDTGAEAAAVDSAPPFGVVLPTSRLGDGAHVLHVLACRADGTRCDSAHEARIPITSTRLHPAVTSVSPHTISPDGDGRRDRTRVTYRIDSTQAPTLVVRNDAGAVVWRKALGTQTAGSHTATWSGRRTGGGTVQDGAFRLEIATSDGTLRGLAGTTVQVDRTAPALRKARVSTSRVLPVRDGYYDALTVSAGSPEQLRRLSLEIRTGAGTVVRTVRTRDRSPGTVGVRWNGRRAGGRLVPGTYRLRLVAEDLAGNRSRSRVRTVDVSGQRLVKRSGSTTVTARDSLEETFADDCSDVFRRTSGRHDGWVSYASGSLCTTGDAYAAGDHQVRLHAAVRYGTVRVSAVGGRADDRYRDSATVVLYDGLQNLSTVRFRLGPARATYRGPRVKAGPLLIRSRVLRWETLTTGVAWYDVQSYRVDYTYYVLR
jgi:flagellar hook assembly protein FlgD